MTARTAVPLLILVAATAGSCRPMPAPAGSVTPLAPRETLITEAQIAQLSVRTAWDVVRLRAPRLTFGQDAGGNPSQVMIQSRQSINSDETPLLVVDGMRMSGIDYLRDIPAAEVHAIHILNGETAEPLYGLTAAGGAIVVETKGGTRTGR